MERKKLIAARRKAKLSQQELAKKISASREAVSQWERAITDPQPTYVRALCTLFAIDDPDDLLSIEDDSPDQNAQDISPISVEEFLSQCTAALSGCWHLLQHKGFAVVGNILSTNVSTLSHLCQGTKHRDNAASLMSQAKILQGVVAIHRLDYAGREMSCLEAVQYGEMTKDHRIHAAALMYLAYTYTYCYPRLPEKAVQLFNEALKLLDSEAYLLESDICMGLAGAYAQCKEEMKALKAIERSKIAMPPIPAQDPSNLYADCALSDCYQWEGRMYVDLAARFPSKKKKYAQKAYDALLKSDSLGAPSYRTASETAIHLADATRGIGDLEEYAKCLETGLRIAIEIDSKMRYSEAFAVLRKAPNEWKKEQKYQDLTKLFIPGRA